MRIVLPAVVCTALVFAAFVWAAAVPLPAQAPPANAAAQAPPPAFGFPPAPLVGTFANLLRDQLRFERRGDAVLADGRLGAADVRIDATATPTGFTGTAIVRGSERPCRGELLGDVLTLHLGDDEWRLQAEVDLDPVLAELGAPVVDDARQWTIAVYLGGDNDLEDAAVADLLEMQRGMPANGVELVVLLDRHADASDTAADWSDTRVLRVRPGSDGVFDTIGVPSERDTGSATTLASFVTGVFRTWPARQHAVVVWDHGCGWGGICIDEDVPGAKDRRELLSLYEVRSGLRTALAAAGLQKLDLLAFDACMMAQLDVALAMHDVADVMVASEAVVPSSGFPYTQLLPAFAGEGSARDVAKAIVREYGAFSETNYKSGSTLAAFDLRHAAGTAARLDVVAAQALTACPQQWHAIARALFYAECYEVRSERVADGANGSIDLIDLSSRLRGIAGIDDDALDALQLQIAALVVDRHVGAERTLSKGLAVYGPHRAGQFRADYEQMPLALGNHWRALLGEVHRRADADAGDLQLGEFRQLDATGQPNAASRPFGGDRLLFTATGKAIVEVQVHDWQFDAGQQQWLLLRKQLVTDPLWPARWAKAAAADMIDLVMPQFVDGRNELFHELTGLSFAITDGTLQAYGSLDLATPSAQAPITAIARCTVKATGVVTLVEVAFDRAAWNVVALRPITRPADGAVARALVPAAGDTFEFWFETRSATGVEGGFFTPPLSWGDSGLALIAEAEEPGRYRASMHARTVGGRTATAAHEYDVVANPDLQAWPDSWKDFDPTTLVGTWTQWQVVGPQQYRELHTTCTVEATDASNVFRVVVRGGAPDDPVETKQFWLFEWRGLPSLRVLTKVADGQQFGWYGPVRRGVKDGAPFLAMKAVNTSGVVWEWRKQ